MPPKFKALAEEQARLLTELRSSNATDRERFFHSLVEALPSAVYTTDVQGRVTFYNEAAVRLWGRSPRLGEDWWDGSCRLFWPDGRRMQRDECPMAQTLKTGKPVRGKWAIAERPDGSRVPFIPYPVPLYDNAGNLIGAVNMLVDISERDAFERAARHLSAVVDSSNDAIVSKDLDGTIRSWNAAAEDLFGYKAAEIVGHSIFAIIPADRHNDEELILSKVRRGERLEHYETVRRRKDGSLVEVSITVSPVFDGAGNVVGASKIARDISERKTAERELEARLREIEILHKAAQREIERRAKAETARELILTETRHRVKNTLAVIQGVAAQTFRDAPSTQRAAFNGRLRALAAASDLITQRHWQSACVAETIEQALNPFERTRFDVGGPALELSASQAVAVLLLLHELATNAVKYGALSNQAGRVALSWCEEETEGAPALVLSWRETGGPQVTQPERKGVGMRMIERALMAESGTTTVEFAPEGFSCTVRLPRVH